MRFESKITSQNLADKGEWLSRESLLMSLKLKLPIASRTSLLELFSEIMKSKYFWTYSTEEFGEM